MQCFTEPDFGPNLSNYSGLCVRNKRNDQGQSQLEASEVASFNAKFRMMVTEKLDLTNHA